jgi:hypothetical protein
VTIWLLAIVAVHAYRNEAFSVDWNLVCPSSEHNLLSQCQCRVTDVSDMHTGPLFGIEKGVVWLSAFGSIEQSVD